MAKERKQAAPAAEMSLEEARAYRASLVKDQPAAISDKEKRDAFKKFWAENKKHYKKASKLEEVIWLHLKAVKMDHPSKFQEGLKHFGLKKAK
jgi:hypothetical protein